MKKIGFIIGIMLMVLASSAVSYADWHGHHGGWGVGVFVAPAPVYPYPVYPAPYPACERVCTERAVPVCRYDHWGDRWCRDEIIRDCRTVCY